ncbi:DUF3375 domain-containing protein [Larkinella punicea]|uniref:DUF3375 domain-containing protein n=1 Tax=Larkinella punicea TaxID=2315727 RepID=A0A368JUX5_9BACT|nr:DUF3375 domain-containing protein [Larkinella punicea]RCR71470.1 DUF3375 domain-containing protein [Larkinella punicea]
MLYPKYQAFFNPERTPVPLKVLRARTAPLILSFLQENFKNTDYTPALTNERLVNNLADFLETWNTRDDEGDLASAVLGFDDRAAKFIRDWVREGYLTLYSDDQGQDMHSLTPDMENVLDWVASLMRKQSFVGTESRFLDIVNKLRDLVQNTSEDWQTKVTELEKQKLAIDEQIRQLTLTQTVQTFEDYQIKERFQEVNLLSRSMLRDFREVESNFRDITQRIYQKQAALDQTKGGLLGYALDALYELRQTDQGRSFEAFYQHLTDPAQKAELDNLIRQVFELLNKRGLPPEDTFVRKIKFYLHSEGQKVNASFYLLAKKLEKIISEKNRMERRKSLMLINEIRALAFEMMDNPPKDEAFLEIDGRPDYLSTDTTISLQERESKIMPRALSVAESEETDFDLLVSQWVIDKSVLLANIKYLLRSEAQVTLRRVVDEFGLTHGLTELMAYGSIAASSEKHIINDARKEIFVISPTNSVPQRMVDFPEIIFCR